MNKSKLNFALKTYLEQEIFLGENEALTAHSPAARDKAREDNARGLEQFRIQIETCRKCPLGKTRIKFVFGMGNPCAKMMFVGEGPGYDEDRRGLPFVGAAGKLLDNMIKAIGHTRETVYIANVVKCHPMKNPAHPDQRGNDRPPNAEEIAVCMPYLHRQITIIRPKVICTLGKTATQALLSTIETITQLRGNFFNYYGILLIPTYHPAALLRDASLKRYAWEDLKKVRDACKD